MQSQLIESMRDQVRTIYRVATGTDMPELQASGAEPEAPLEEVTRSFAELEALTRIAGEPAIDLERGLLRVRLKRSIENHPQEETLAHHSSSQ